MKTHKWRVDEYSFCLISIMVFANVLPNCTSHLCHLGLSEKKKRKNHMPNSQTISWTHRTISFSIKSSSINYSCLNLLHIWYQQLYDLAILYISLKPWFHVHANLTLAGQNFWMKIFVFLGRRNIAKINQDKYGTHYRNKFVLEEILSQLKSIQVFHGRYTLLS